MCTPTQGVWQPAGCVSCEPVCVCVSLVRVVIICPASTHTALVSSPSLTVVHLSTYIHTMVTSKRKFDFEGSYLKRPGESKHYCCILCHIRSDLTPEASRTRCSGSTVPAHCLLAPTASSRRGPWCTRERGRRVAPAGDPARLRPARRCVVTAPWQECGEELAEREQQMAKVCQRESLASGRRRSSP